MKAIINIYNHNVMHIRVLMRYIDTLDKNRNISYWIYGSDHNPKDTLDAKAHGLADNIVQYNDNGITIIDHRKENPEIHLLMRDIDTIQIFEQIVTIYLK